MRSVIVTVAEELRRVAKKSESFTQTRAQARAVGKMLVKMLLACDGRHSDKSKERLDRLLDFVYLLPHDELQLQQHLLPYLS